MATLLPIYFSPDGIIHLAAFLMDRKELTADARELKGELYCLPCHDKMGVPICGACRRPIEGRVVNAMGKQWHVEVSSTCIMQGQLILFNFLGSDVLARLGDFKN